MVNNATLPSNNPSHFRCNLLERMLKVIMAIDDKIRDEENQYNINRGGAKIPPLSSRKTDKNEYLTGDEISLSNQS